MSAQAFARWAALAAFLAASPAASQTREVTLDEALRLALAAQPSMVEAEGDVRIAGADKRSSIGNFLPSITAGASSGRITSRHDDFSKGFGASYNLTLFDGFSRIASRRIAVANAEAADAGLRGERFQVILETKEIFYAEAASEDLMRVAEAQVARATEQLNVANDKFQAGSGVTSDTLRATVELGTAQMSLIRAQAANSAAMALLARQIGEHGLVRARRDETMPVPPDTTEVRQLSRTESPDVLVTEANARAAEAGVTSARSLYWPSLGVSAGDDWFAPTMDDDYTHSSSVMFSLGWTIFDGFDREGEQVRADVQRDAANARAADTRRLVDAEVTRQMALLNAAYRQIEIATLNVAAANEDFRVQSERYRLGVATSLDLTTTQENLTEAEVDLIQARFDYLIARAELEALVGREL